ncbi:hypothetical protein LWI28_019545 [Acer negundo]|uniref:Uncharacterized protein n=1 Tax=Acer negundo TaxID=4023 RepID=A0AAD5IRT6_ACENE|nr:hypothetical protein LWI28_019545 [Acer negundo]
MEELDEISIDPDRPERKVFIRSRLSIEIHEQMIDFLKERRSSFAWSYEDIIGIDPVHKLHVDPKHEPVRQKRRKFAPKRNKVINEEIQKLLDIDSVKEVKYPDWLANVVVVKKKNDKWRVCINFMDLNKTCPKDSFPLPHIDMLVDATSRHELLSFMDVYSGYNQILMHPDDQEKTAFVTERGTFCYKVMHFGLKNARATYQRLVNKMFADMLGMTIEVYIDDLLVKSLMAQQHIEDLRQSFDIIDKYGMKLNPAKCSFGVSSGKFLGYLVTQRGIKANPNQIRSIQGIESPRCIKDVQKLTGRVATLNSCEKALQDLKHYLTTPPLLSKPKDDEISLVYLVVSDTAVSAVLIREEGNIQHLVYYVSKAFLDAETRYSRLEKLALALVVTARKLRPYFQCHPIKVLTTYPLKSILHKPELSGRLTKWTVEPSEHEISFHPRTALKSQVLADFIADFTPSKNVQAEQELVDMTENVKDEKWTLSIDGSSNIKGSGLDALAGLGSTTSNGTKSIPVVHLMSPTIQAGEVLTPVDHGKSWMDPILAYLQADILLGDRSDSRKVKAKAVKFCIMYGKLYKKSFTGPYLRCVTPREAYDFLKSLHHEECGNHSGARSLSNKGITAGYYWPTMCKLPEAQGGIVYMLMLTDYFTKWVEIGAFRQVRNIEVRNFVWRNIICRFSIPREIVTNNGSQFISYDFKNFCDKYGIKLSFSTPRYPQANGQTESTNKTILNSLKKRLEAEKGQWAEKLPEILWSYRTTPRRSTCETPFSLVYGSEAVIPIETRLPTARSEDPNEEQNSSELSFELDHLDEQ